MKSPQPMPWSEDDDVDTTPNFSPWVEAMRWAKRGQMNPLIDALRGTTPITVDDASVREFLADFLAGKIKRRRGTPPRPGDWTFGTVGPGKDDIAAIKKTYADVCRAANLVWQYEREAKLSGSPKRGLRIKAIENAVRKLRLNEKRQNELETWLRRSPRARRRLASRSN